MKSTLKYVLPLMAVTGIACFLFFRFAFPYHLLHKEETILFICSADVLSSYLDKPAVVSCLAGDFLTQFFQSVTVGATVFTAMILLLEWEMFAVCRRWTGN